MRKQIHFDGCVLSLHMTFGLLFRARYNVHFHDHIPKESQPVQFVCSGCGCNDTVMTLPSHHAHQERGGSETKLLSSSLWTPRAVPGVAMQQESRALY